METKEIDVNKLSKLYPQLDELTPDEKGKAIDYLVKSLRADNNTTNIETSNQKTNTELLATISESQAPESKKGEIKEENEQIEKLTAKDLDVYIHGNPGGHKAFGEKNNRRDDPFLKKGHFDIYYSHLGNNEVIVRNLGNGCIEYTIKRPSCEVIERPGGYLGLTIILKNGYKIKGTSSLSKEDYGEYLLNTEVGDFMDSFMKYLIKDCDLVVSKSENLVQWKYTDEERIRKVIFKIKNTFIRSMNEEEANKGLIIKDNP